MGTDINARLSGSLTVDDTRLRVRAYIRDNILLGVPFDLHDSSSLLEAGILDSTGAMEMVSFLEEEFAITMADDEIVADNIDSIDKICAFVSRKRA